MSDNEVKNEEVDIDELLRQKVKNIKPQEPVRGMPVSGRKQKQAQTKRFSDIKKKRTKNYNFSGWEKQQEERGERKRIQDLKCEIKQKEVEQKESKKKLREEQEARKLENERKAEQIQIISNSTKLKKLSRKQWKQIEKR